MVGGHGQLGMPGTAVGAQLVHGQLITVAVHEKVNLFEVSDADHDQAAVLPFQPARRARIRDGA